MLDARKSGALTLRFNMYLPGSGVRDIERMRMIVAQSPLKQDEGDEWVRVGGVKLGIDGGFEGGLMTKPFLGEIGKNGTYFGINRVPAEPFNAIVKMLNAGGWRVTTHAVGDAALDQVLDAYEAANAERPLAGPALGGGASVRVAPRPGGAAQEARPGAVGQNHLCLAASSLKNYLGMERASQITPVKTYLDTGLLVVGGTDSPVVPLQFFWSSITSSPATRSPTVSMARTSA
jgi:predicted amidohydrolase YtcJ